MKKLVLVALVLAVAFLGACSSNVAESKSGVQKIIVGTGTQFPNVCFIDENGKLTGYDVELVRAIDEKLEDYEFEFKTMDFTNLLLSLETNKIDVVAHQMEVNEERQEKFLFNKEPYNVFPLQIVVNENNNDIQSIEDLAGKKIATTATSNAAIFIEKYNKEHNLGAEIVYSTTDINNQLRTGRVDATISTPFAAEFNNKYADAQQKVVGESLLNSKVFFLLQKENTALSDSIDEALIELKEEGVVSALSEEWLGADYTVGF
ncbi:amino acid ABC transporter substrate-binding protein, PAAT family [Psychrobacillus sp. OK028]|uniref:transporter substrate-binding domain-containing protein n=1 Tax=Psychrobacillus sp. OK028 TaxID=1884359 RepID=UPI00088CC3D4|nr:transporter substrate-binding domain-containing protein [Psychrobacillus sp. OK028]SDN78549.1 amino acid ABC transporter substrate-binding protein, PAAT family [Psychrobacillus sp. OK028]